jgi:FAD synthetase
MSVERMDSEKRVMVFGVFDGLHNGHCSFLDQARALGNHVIAVVARDESVMRLKNHAPQYSLAERVGALLNSELVDRVESGDEAEGEWGVILKHRPNIVALGYDQHAMAEHLMRALPNFPFACEVVMLEAYHPEKYHSSILNGGNETLK